MQVKQTTSKAQAMLDWVKAIFLPASSKNIIMATHLEPATPNRPNDLTETTIASRCIMPQKQSDVAKMSLSPTSARWSDLTVVCGSQTFEAHKVIVCSQVGYPPYTNRVHRQVSFSALSPSFPAMPVHRCAKLAEYP